MTLDDDMTVDAAAVVSLPPMVERQTQAWTALLDLAPSFGRHWTLIGGQMVLLLQTERTSPHAHWTPRASDDLDMVVNLRASKTAMRDIDAALRQHGFAQMPAEISHRYRRETDNVCIDVMAPDHIGSTNPALGSGRTLSTSGGTQALKRTQWVEVALNGNRASIPRPNLVGALLIKCAAVMDTPSGKDGPRRHITDAVALALMLTPEDQRTAGLTKSERRRLRKMASVLEGHPLSDAIMQRAATQVRRLEAVSQRKPATGSSQRTESGQPDREHAMPAATPVACGQTLRGRRVCQRRLVNAPCPVKGHGNSPGSRTVRQRQRLARDQ